YGQVVKPTNYAPFPLAREAWRSIFSKHSSLHGRVVTIGKELSCHPPAPPRRRPPSTVDEPRDRLASLDRPGGGWTSESAAEGQIALGPAGDAGELDKHPARGTPPYPRRLLHLYAVILGFGDPPSSSNEGDRPFGDIGPG